MMVQKKLMILGGVLIFLIAVTLLLEGPLKKRYKEKATRREFIPDFKKEEIEAVELKKKEEKVLLKKVDDKWQVASLKNRPADTEKLKELLEKIESFTCEEIISRNPKKQKIFEVTPTEGTQVKLIRKNKPLFTFFVGKTGPDYNSTYIRAEGANEVFLVPYYLASLFSVEADDWLDKEIFKLDSESIEEISWRDIKLRKAEKGNWEIVTSKGILPCKKFSARSIASSFASLRAREYADEEKPLEDYGLAKPKEQISVKVKEGGSKSLLVGKKKDDTTYYVKRQDGDYVYTLSKWSLENIMKELPELIEKKVFSFSKEDVQRIRVEYPQKKFVLEKKDTVWEVVQPSRYKAHQEIVSDILEGLTDLEAEEVKAGLSLKECGLEKPAFELGVKLKEGELRKLAVGKRIGENYYVRRDEKSYIYLIKKEKIKRLQRELEEIKGEKIEKD
jgi:hypothetical protein